MTEAQNGQPPFDEKDTSTSNDAKSQPVANMSPSVIARKVQGWFHREKQALPAHAHSVQPDLSPESLIGTQKPSNLETALSSFKGVAKGERAEVVEIPRELTVEELRHLPQLSHEVGLSIHSGGIYVIKGDAHSIARVANAGIKNPKPAIIDIHSHPVLKGKADKEHGGVYDYEPESISPADVYVVGLEDRDTIRTVITEQGLVVYGWPTKTPEGLGQVDLTERAITRELMAMYGDRRKVNFLGGDDRKYFHDLLLAEQDRLMHDFIQETGMLITQIPWSDQRRITQAIHALNTATDRQAARQQFASLK